MSTDTTIAIQLHEFGGPEMLHYEDAPIPQYRVARLLRTAGGHVAVIMPKKFKRGQAVEWNSPQGKVQGIVERTVTQATRVKGHVAKANPKHPEVLVRSSKTGAEAIHLPHELRSAK
jgi:hypothetical protein